MALFMGGGLLSLLLLGLPIAFALAILGIGVIFFLGGGLDALNQVPIIAYKTLNSQEFSALPLYILMSQILIFSGVGKDLFEMANRWVRHLPGGMVIATLLCSGVFAAISGSSVATCMTIGLVAYPELTSRGYDKKLAVGAIAAGGTLGILIPPSGPMIIYGLITDASIGKLFMAGVVPGLLLLLGFILYSAIKTRHLRQEPASWAERWEATKTSIWGVSLPVFILGGIYSGIVTPTEAAALGVLLSILIAHFVYKCLNIYNIKKIILSTASSSTMIMFIIIGAMVLGYALTLSQIPQALTAWVTALPVSKWVILIAINILLFILGAFLETVSILVITLPLLFPIITGLGFDPIWFCVMMVINLEVALISPPVGMNLFVLQGVDKSIDFGTTARGALPYMILMTLFIIILTIFPEIALWLPDLSSVK